MPVKVLFDSNFLMVPAQFHVDIFQGTEDALNTRAEYLVLPETVEELRRLAARRGRRGREAKLALRLAERCTVLAPRAKPGKTTDELLLEAAREERLVAATNDSALRKQLRELGLPVLYLRKKAYVALEGSLNLAEA